MIYLADKDNNSELFLSKFLNIQLIWNDGIAFGLLSLNKDKSYDILTLFIFFIIVIIFFMMTKSEGLKRYSFLMIFSKASLKGEPKESYDLPKLMMRSLHSREEDPPSALGKRIPLSF